jgi:hypothetical protein
VIYSGVLGLCEELEDEISEAEDQLSKQLARYRELQIKKVEEPREVWERFGNGWVR